MNISECEDRKKEIKYDLPGGSWLGSIFDPWKLLPVWIQKGPQESQVGMKQNSLLLLLTPQHTIIILVLLFLFPSCRRSTTAASDRRHHEEERRYLPLFVSKDALDCPLFLF